MEDNYQKAYKEVIEILKFVPKESVNKIPQTMLDTFKAKMDKNYNFKVDINKNFEEQELLEETKAILANIFRNYWATDYQREQILAKEQQDRKKDEEEKRIKYNTDVFKNKKMTITNKQKEKLNIEKQSNKNYSNNLLVTVKKQNIFHRLLGFIKGFLNIR